MLSATSMKKTPEPEQQGAGMGREEAVGGSSGIGGAVDAVRIERRELMRRAGSSRRLLLAVPDDDDDNAPRDNDNIANDDPAAAAPTPSFVDRRDALRREKSASAGVSLSFRRVSDVVERRGSDLYSDDEHDDDGWRVPLSAESGKNVAAAAAESLPSSSHRAAGRDNGEGGGGGGDRRKKSSLSLARAAMSLGSAALTTVLRRGGSSGGSSAAETGSKKKWAAATPGGRRRSSLFGRRGSSASAPDAPSEPSVLHHVSAGSADSSGGAQAGGRRRSSLLSQPSSEGGVDLGQRRRTSLLSHPEGGSGDAAAIGMEEEGGRRGEGNRTGFIRSASARVLGTSASTPLSTAGRGGPLLRRASSSRTLPTAGVHRRSSLSSGASSESTPRPRSNSSSFAETNFVSQNFLSRTLSEHPTTVPLDTIKQIVQLDPAAVRETDARENGALHVAANFGCPPEVVQYLLKANPDMAVEVNSEERTALHLAAAPVCQTDAAPRSGAGGGEGPEGREDREGEGATADVIRMANLDVARVLYDANPMAAVMQDDSGLTPLDLAVEYGSPEEVVRFLRKKMDKLGKKWEKRMRREEEESKAGIEIRRRSSTNDMFVGC